MSDGRGDENIASSRRANMAGASALLALSIGVALPAAIAIVALWADDWRPAALTMTSRLTGWLACVSLVATLGVSPLAESARRWRRRRTKLQWMPAASNRTVAAAASPEHLEAHRAAHPRGLLPKAAVMRRTLGIGSASFALAHAGIGLIGPLRDALEVVWSWPGYRAAATALSLLVLLLLTSWPQVVSALRLRVWKPLHQAAHAAMLLVLMHMTLMPQTPLWALSILVTVYGMLIVWRLALVATAGVSTRRGETVALDKRGAMPQSSSP